MDERLQLRSLLSSFFAMQMILDPYGEFYKNVDDIIDSSSDYDETVEDCKFYLNLELIKLLNDGYTDDDIIEKSHDIICEKFKNLTLEQQERVENDTKKLIMKRKERFNYE